MKLYGFIIYDSNHKITCYKYLNKESYFESNNINSMLLKFPDVLEEYHIIEEKMILYIFEYKLGSQLFKIYSIKDLADNIMVVITDLKYKDNVICKILSEIKDYDCESLTIVFSIYSNIKSGFGYNSCEFKIVKKDKIDFSSCL